MESCIAVDVVLSNSLKIDDQCESKEGQRV